jgi:hypothetical protein
LVTGEPRRVEVVAALPLALHLAVCGAGPDLPPSVCLTLPGAVRLPSAVLVRGGWGSVRIGTVGVVGGGGVALPGLSVRVARWWRAPRPTLRPTVTMPGPTVLDPDTASLVDHLAAALGAPLWIRRGRSPLIATPGVIFPENSHVDDLDGPVTALLGRGPGLTPLGDDILAGALVTLRAIGSHETAAALVGAILPKASRTTSVSAALLWHAARGECVPELADLFRALNAGHGVERARANVLRLGHTSGAGLLHGVAAALRGLTALPGAAALHGTRPREECA